MTYITINFVFFFHKVTSNNNIYHFSVCFNVALSAIYTQVAFKSVQISNNTTILYILDRIEISLKLI